MHAERLDRVRAAMAEQGVEVLLLSVGPDLPWLIGYEAMPLERLTMLVVPADGDATLVVPRLEAPRVVERPDVFTLDPWDETDDPIARVADRCGRSARLAIGDRTWARFLVDLQSALPEASFGKASDVTAPLRAIKDDAEIDALRRAGAAADRVAAQLQGGDIRARRSHRGRGVRRHRPATPRRGPPARQLRHRGGGRQRRQPPPRCRRAQDRARRRRALRLRRHARRRRGSGVLLGHHPMRPPRPAAHRPRRGLRGAARGPGRGGGRRAGGHVVRGGRRHRPDASSRTAGYGDRFVHRTGHGIGVEEHEDPYVVAGNTTALRPGHAFSVEPGIYTPGRWGLRLEDIVVATEGGPDSLNRVDHDLVVLDV